MKVALLGPKGTYTHQAARNYFKNIEAVFFSTLEEVYNSEINTKFVPIENSLGGGVSDSIELLRNTENEITGEHILKIEHMLISKEKSIEDIEKVSSHPQALNQCNEFLKKQEWEQIETSSTASAVENLEPGEAAIASKTAAEINNVNVLKRNIQDKDNNVTRFFILNHETDKPDKTAMILEPGIDKPGLLSSMLSCFSGHQINLTHIQSMPTRDQPGEYYFFIEAASNKDSKEFKNAKKCLETYTDVEILGSYKQKQWGQ